MTIKFHKSSKLKALKLSTHHNDLCGNDKPNNVVKDEENANPHENITSTIPQSKHQNDLDIFKSLQQPLIDKFHRYNDCISMQRLLSCMKK